MECARRTLRLLGAGAVLLLEMLDYPRLTTHGTVIPIEAWDRTMARIIGVSWNCDDEADILATAERIRGGAGGGDAA